MFSHYAGRLTRTSAYASIVRAIDTSDQGDTSGLRHAAPGARVSVAVTQDAAGSVEFQLGFDGLMVLTGAYNAAGVVLVDGAVAATYDMPLVGKAVPVGTLEVKVPVPAGRHTVSLVLPYAASVRLLGMTYPATAQVAAGPPPPTFRVVLLGDSRLNGSGAADITGTIAFELARRLNAEVINIAYGGRQLAAGDFAIAGKLAPDVAISLYDFNNFYRNGARLDEFGRYYRAGMQEFLEASARAGKPGARLLVVTSFASSSDADFLPAGPYARNVPSLEAFRSQERSEAASLASPRVTVVEGRSSGMPAATVAYAADGVHFNSAAQLLQAQTLAAAIR